MQQYLTHITVKVQLNMLMFMWLQQFHGERQCFLLIIIYNHLSIYASLIFHSDIADLEYRRECVAPNNNNVTTINDCILLDILVQTFIIFHLMKMEQIHSLDEVLDIMMQIQKVHQKKFNC